jgi:nickel-type superoxide dismutase maturation protease
MSIIPFLVRAPVRLVRGRGVALAAAVVAGLLLLPAVRRVEVEGSSMVPALLPGDRLVVVGRSRWSRLMASGRWPAIGEVVAVRDPRRVDRLLVKRISAVDPAEGTVTVLGDAPASTDSRTFGPVPRSSVVGRAVYRYAPAVRVGAGPWAEEYHRA